jgi:hypothetical protein
MGEWKNNAQECLDRLCDKLLGKDYYIVDPIGRNQANEILTQDIVDLYQRYFKKEK